MNSAYIYVSFDFDGHSWGRYELRLGYPKKKRKITGIVRCFLRILKLTKLPYTFCASRGLVTPGVGVEEGGGGGK